MKFADFTPEERLLLLHALEDEVHLLNCRTSFPIAPDAWQDSHELLRTSLLAERDGLEVLLKELRELVKLDLNS